MTRSLVTLDIDGSVAIRLGVLRGETREEGLQLRLCSVHRNAGLESALDNISHLTYTVAMSPTDRPLVWLHGELKTPPFSKAARLEAGFLLRRLQRGEQLSLPHSRPMPTIGRRCHELRINDERQTWRVIYRTDPDAIILLEVFSKRTAQTPKAVLANCKRRLQEYDNG